MKRKQPKKFKPTKLRGINAYKQKHMLSRRGRGRGQFQTFKNREDMLKSHRQTIELQESELEAQSAVHGNEISVESEKNFPHSVQVNFFSVFLNVRLLTCLYHFVDEAKIKCGEYLNLIKAGTYTHSIKENTRSSIAWEAFHEIFDNDGKAVKHFYFCFKCETVLYSLRTDGNTSKLLRHYCVKSNRVPKANINPRDLENIKQLQLNLFVWIFVLFTLLSVPAFVI